jgi:hypothetical protein
MGQNASNCIRGILAAALLAGGVGCGSETEPPSRLDAWTASIRAVAPIEAAERLEALRAKEGLPLSFWAGEKAGESSAVEVIRSEHPCGPIAISFVDRIPALEPGAALESERVVELGPSGDVIRTWPVPVDTVVEGVRGEELLFSESFDRGTAPPLAVRLAVRPDGTYRVEPGAAVLPAPASVDCPPLDLWEDSAYVRCWRTRDPETGAERTIAYQGPCT